MGQERGVQVGTNKVSLYEQLYYITKISRMVEAQIQ
jgi:hypothetical protein